ncbi:MAG: RodZ domain-containing protein [Betaproteobacteria bacterium]
MTSPVSEQSYGQEYAQPSPGAQLRALREAAQLTVDDVAQQLKLARRQVLAIENDAVDELPGPTFVRGFIRNYARLLRVDAEPLLEAGNLIAPSAASIEHIAPTMGELPLDNVRGPSWTRWLIPTALIMVLGAGIAYYEFGDVSTSVRKARKDRPEVESTVVAPSVQSESVAPPATDAAAAGAKSVNVVQAFPAPTEAPAAAAPVIEPVPAAAATSMASAPTQAVAAATLPAGSSRIELELTQPAWVEIRDARGEALVSRTLRPEDKPVVTGVPPFAVRIGNASAVRLQFDGTPVDLAPHIKAEIARLTLPLRHP